MFVFTWLRQKARDAVLAGVGDALGELEGGDDGAAAIARLRALAAPGEAKAIGPVPEAGEPEVVAGKRGRKA